MATGVVVIVNVALVLPPGTVTVAGSLAAVELSLSETTAPPIGAAAVNVTVPWDVLPPATLVGLTESELNAGVLACTVYCTVAVDTVEPTRTFTPVLVVRYSDVLAGTPFRRTLMPLIVWPEIWGKANSIAVSGSVAPDIDAVTLNVLPVELIVGATMTWERESHQS